MPVFTNAKSPFWQYEYQHSGDRFRGSFNGKSGRPRIPKDRPQKEAERAEALLRSVNERPAERPRLTLHDACARYWTEKAQYFAGASGEWGRLAHLERLLGKTVYLDGLSDADLSKYVALRRAEPAKRKKTTVAHATINREIECLGRILKRAKKPWRVELPTELDLSVHKLEEPRERIRALTSDEDVALFKAIDKIRPDFRDMLEFALLTGKRLSEVIFLEKRRVDRRAMECRVIEKGGREIVITLTETTLAIIDRNWMHHPTRVFTYICQQSRTGKTHAHRKGRRYPFTKGGWRKPWKAILTEAKIQDFRFHDLRHTAGTRVLQATGNLKAVQDALSHKDIASSARYAHTTSTQRREALAAAEKLRMPESARKRDGDAKKKDDAATS